MAPLIPAASSPAEVPIPVGQHVRVDDSVEFVGDQVITGGHPWRLLRLNSGAIRALRSWQDGAPVTPENQRLARSLRQQGILRLVDTEPLPLADVTIVIPVFNDLAGLQSLLPRLRGVAVIVIDDCSPRGNELRLLVDTNGASYVRLPSNQGPAAARNHGAGLATTPYVWFLDSDVESSNCRSEWDRLSGAFRDPLVAAVAPRIMGSDGAGVLGKYESRHGPLDLGPAGGLVVPRARVSYVPTASLVVRLSAFGEGFDESLRTGEDVDFIWRLTQRGWLVEYRPDVVQHHRSRPDTRKWLRQRHGYGRSAATLAERHPNELFPLRVDAWTLASWLTLLLRQPKWTASTVAIATRGLKEKLPESLEDRDEVAQRVVTKGIATSGGPLAQAIVRSYSPLLIVGLLSKRTRSVSGVLLLAGTVWKVRSAKRHVLVDAPVALVDDLAYATGVWRGAWEARSWHAVKPTITFATGGLQALLKKNETPSTQR